MFALSAVLLLAAVHVFGGTLRFLDVTPRSRWLSAAGGASVAYVFLHLMPELAHAGRSLAEVPLLRRLETHAYLVALVGLVLFYGLEHFARRSAGQPETPSQSTSTIFWLHLSSFAAYNALVGYLLVRREGLSETALYAAAMALHFLVNDFGLRHDYASAYHDLGRWLLSGAVLLGWLAGVSLSLPEPAIDGFFAFLAGGIVLNVLKEELPEERASRFGAFALGAAGYTALLLAAS